VPRAVTLVLVDGVGALLGALPPVVVDSVHWQDVDEVVRAVQDGHGLSVQVLRLLTTQLPRPPGGAVSYLAELTQPPPRAGFGPVDPSALALAEEDSPLRPAYARPGGPTASIAWARSVLGPVPVAQLRTWNLSAIWRLGGARRRFWLKQLPDFYRHEPVALNWLNQAVPGVAPELIAVGPQGRELLGDVPGVDLYRADLRVRLQVMEQAHLIQLTARPAVEHLLAQGLPDLRGGAPADRIRAALAGWPPGSSSPASPVASSHADLFGDLLAGLDERLAAVSDRGLPDTLVHGDAHPGNVRDDGERMVILDWSDCFVGNPALDVLKLVEGLPSPQEQVLLDAWAAGWQRQAPGSDPLGAVQLLRPVGHLLAAAQCAEFVARIEPAERPYHSFDVPAMLDRALDAV
jgi:Phosphotransferase enzyme family